MTRFIFELVQGLMIGAGAILPGISGASLAVVFGVYEDFLELVAHPFRNVRPFARKHASLCVGIGIGFASFTLIIDRAFSDHMIPLVFLFSGFIAGTLPGIYKSAKKHGIGKGEVIAFFLTAGTLTALAIAHHSTGGLLAASTGPEREGNLVTWFLSGSIIGTGSLLPGLSASLILIYLGMYGPLLDAIGRLDLPVAISLGAGALSALILFSRIIDALYRHFHGIMSFAVLGFTLGSLILAFPGMPTGTNALVCTALLPAGFAASYFLERSQA